MIAKYIFSVGLLCSSFNLYGQQHIEILEKIKYEVEQQSEAYRQLEYATTTIGHRATGTGNGDKAEQFAAQLLESYGYEVEMQPFYFNGWNRGSLTFTINGEEVPAVALALSPAKAITSHQLVDLGNGLEEDYLKLKEKLAGKIVLATIGLLDGTPENIKNLHRSEKTALAEKYGASGIILFNKAKGNILLTGTASVTGDIIKIPSINISYEEGMKIKKALRAGAVKAEIIMENEVGPMKGSNIIVRQKGITKPDEIIVVGGHLDSWDLATGAIDNGVGSFSVIDVARTFKQSELKTDRTIEFVLFMGEEVGLLGSKHYVKEAIKSGKINQIKAMSNMDMTYDPKAFSSTMLSENKFLQELAQDVLTYDQKFEEHPVIGLGLHSDHQPFMLQGIPIVGLSKSQFKPGALDCYHANCDEMKFVDPQGLKHNVTLETYLLYRLANAQEFPYPRWTEDQIKQALIQANLETPLKISGEWRWK